MNIVRKWFDEYGPSMTDEQNARWSVFANYAEDDDANMLFEGMTFAEADEAVDRIACKMKESDKEEIF